MEGIKLLLEAKANVHSQFEVFIIDVFVIVIVIGVFCCVVIVGVVIGERRG